MVVAPSLLFGSEAVGFSAAMLGATALTVAAVVPAVMAWIGPGAAGGAETAAGANREVAAPAVLRATALRRRAFWILTLPFALGLLAQVGFIVHQIALLEPKIG